MNSGHDSLIRLSMFLLMCLSLIFNLCERLVWMGAKMIFGRKEDNCYLKESFLPDLTCKNEFCWYKFMSLSWFSNNKSFLIWIKPVYLDVTTWMTHLSDIKFLFLTVYILGCITQVTFEAKQEHCIKSCDIRLTEIWLGSPLWASTAIVLWQGWILR